MDRPNYNFITFDIETYNENNLFKILTICFGSGKIQHEFYISKYKTTNKLLDAVFNKLFTKEFAGFIVYISIKFSINIFIWFSIIDNILLSIVLVDSYSSERLLNLTSTESTKFIFSDKLVISKVINLLRL